MKLSSLLIAASLVLAGTTSLAAQDPTPATQPRQQVSKIVAVAGDSIILAQEVETDLRVLTLQNGQQLPTDSAQLNTMRRQVLETMINNLLILQAALRDTTIQIPEAQLNQRVEAEIQGRVQQAGGQAGLERALQAERWTMQDYRAFIANGMRQQALREAWLASATRMRKPRPIGEGELKKIFEEQRATIPPLPPIVTFQQIMLAPRASDAALAAARTKTDSILQLVKGGEDFATLARRFSMDGSAEKGGDLGWMKPAEFVREFADALMMLRPGMVSGIVETQYGFHIIKLEKVRGGERQARHILIMPERADGDLERTLERGREVAEKLRAGANPDSLAREVGEDYENSRVGPYTRDQVKQIAPAYDQALGASPKTGDVVGPFQTQLPTGQPAVVVLKILDAREAGPASWDDTFFRQRFKDNIQRQQLIEEIINELRAKSHVEIRSL